MKKRIISINLIFLLAVSMSLFCFAPVAYADKTINEVQGNLDDVNSELDDVKDDLSSVVKRIEEAERQVNYISSRVSSLSSDIEKTEKKIKKKQNELTERKNNMNKRLVVMYKNGSVGFVDVLLGSNSISEFISNLEMVKKIYRNDMEILQTLNEEYEELQRIKADLEEKKQDLSKQKEELAEKKKKLDEEKKVLSEKEDELKAEADRLSYELLTLIDISSEYVGGTFTWPCPSSKYITSSFGYRIHPILKYWKMHTGVDIGASTGKDIIAAGSGRVIKAEPYGAYGNCVMIDHGGGIVTLYGHASKLCCKAGDVVARGTKIAEVGMTGTATGPHLHFEVRVNGEYVDPMQYF